MEKQSKKDLNIMYKRILVPTDGTPMSEKAVVGAARFAKSLGASLVLDHLAELGHRDILHLSGPLDWLDARARA